jgi:hypothetical protein
MTPWEGVKCAFPGNDRTGLLACIQFTIESPVTGNFPPRI